MHSDLEVNCLPNSGVFRCALPGGLMQFQIYVNLFLLSIVLFCCVGTFWIYGGKFDFFARGFLLFFSFFNWNSGPSVKQR